MLFNPCCAHIPRRVPLQAANFSPQRCWPKGKAEGPAPYTSHIHHLQSAWCTKTRVTPQFWHYSESIHHEQTNKASLSTGLTQFSSTPFSPRGSRMFKGRELLGLLPQRGATGGSPVRSPATCFPQTCRNASLFELFALLLNLLGIGQ